MKIKVRLINPNCRFEFINKGEWIDLKSSITVDLEGPFANTLNGGRTKRDVVFDYKMIPLGFAMELPHGFEAYVLPRSSSYKHFGIQVVNSQAVIDESFKGDLDEWKLLVLAYKDATILEGDRIAQFRIMPSQKASFWTKIKWLFTSKIEFEYVDSLNNENRGGVGSTGVNSCFE